jgi:predicted nucleic acid-binding protein
MTQCPSLPASGSLADASASPKLGVILDTNIVLDLFLFQDPRTEPLRQKLQSGQLRWLATAHMRNELERVLTYAHIAAKLAFYSKTPADILAQFDRWAHITPQPSAKAPYNCKDPDDQAFVDLAVACSPGLNTDSNTSARTDANANPNLFTGAHPSLLTDAHSTPFALSLPEGVPPSKPSPIHLISKDKAILSMRKRLAKLSICVSPSLEI